MDQYLQNKKSQAIFTALTSKSIVDLYPQAELTDEELEKTLRYMLQQRTTMYLAYKCSASYLDLQNISAIESNVLSDQVFAVLCSSETSPQNIRQWWKDGGRDWSYKHRADVKKFLRDSQYAWVFRDDSIGMFLVDPETSSFSQTPHNALGFVVTSYPDTSLIHSTLESQLNTRLRCIRMNLNALVGGNIKK